MKKRITIGHVPVDRVTSEDAIWKIDAFISVRRGGYVVTPNIDHIVLAARDPRLRDAYRRASLSLADGQPVVWMARALGARRQRRASGSDLIAPLMAHAAARGWKVFLFGARPEVSAEAARVLVERHPALDIVGRDSSHWSPDETAAPEDSPVVRAVRASGAQLLVVALGCPKQELWMARHAEALGPVVSIGLGGSLDFVAGAVARAPSWMSDAGLEWAYRLAQEPRRLADRYLVRDIRIVPIFTGELVRRAFGRLQQEHS
jgi:N-acetylglucosaminyldiphosphoundecaprenol N-acetyl-beta-D-mannosaminyltransferase